MSMSSVNISITEEVYNLLKSLKQENQSFSDIIRNLVQENDISRCYGILRGREKELRQVEDEAARARRQKWKMASL
jgi:predicted CopG family antitoxin